MSGIVRKKNPAQAGLQTTGGILLSCWSRCTADDLIDQRCKPLWRMIVSACPPSILAFRLVCGRMAYCRDSVTADKNVDIGRRKSCGQTFGDRMERKLRMMPSVSSLSASNPFDGGDRWETRGPDWAKRGRTPALPANCYQSVSVYQPFKCNNDANRKRDGLLTEKQTDRRVFGWGNQRVAGRRLPLCVTWVTKIVTRQGLL